MDGGAGGTSSDEGIGLEGRSKPSRWGEGKHGRSVGYFKQNRTVR